MPTSDSITERMLDTTILADECDHYGLPHSLPVLLRHIRGNHAAIVNAKDYMLNTNDDRMGRAIQVLLNTSEDQDKRELLDAISQAFDILTGQEEKRVHNETTGV